MVTTLEICAGAGGQALGLEQAGFHHVALVEIEKQYCETLRRNRPQWNVICQDVQEFQGTPFRDQVDLLAGGVPCPPFSVAGKQLGRQDERDLFPEAIRLAGEIRPKAIMLENVRGLKDPKFDEYRGYIASSFESMGYDVSWRLVQASEFGVPQLRPRMILVGIQKSLHHGAFAFPDGGKKAPSVGEALWDLLGERGWKGAGCFREKADRIAPTIVGGSKKHGGPDLGPTRAKRAWAEMGIDGKGIANEAPEADFEGMPRLTCRMVARIQGFPDEWQFSGSKTAQYRQIGNAFPPPVAKAIGREIKEYIRWRQ